MFGLAACSPTRRLQEGEVFLKENVLEIAKGAELEVPAYELEELIRPKTNRKTLVFRFNLWAYNLVDADKQLVARQRNLVRLERKMQRLGIRMSEQDSGSRRADHIQERITHIRAKRILGWRDWLRETVGEPPVLLDYDRSKQSAEYLEIYLSKQGYFQNNIELLVDTSRNGKKATTRFVVHPGPAFIIDTVKVSIRDTLLAEQASRIMAGTLLQKGERFNVDRLDDERDRIAHDLTARGYFGFIKDYISFEADSSLVNSRVSMNLILNGLPVQSPGKADSIIQIPHRKFFIRDIHVHTDYELTSSEYAVKDTLHIGGTHLYFNGEPSIDPDVILCTLGFAPGDLYAKERIDKTYRRFLELDVFNSVNMRFETVLDGEIPQLDVVIFLDPAKKHAVSFETRGTHRDGNMGIEANLSYRHRNLFAGAESLQSGLRFGVEAQPLLTTEQGSGELGSDVANTLRLNTFEFGPEVTLKLHRLFPLGCDRMSRSSNPQTELTGAFNYQLRADYERNLWKIRFGYHWYENVDKGRQIFWDVLEVSEINIDKSAAFQAILDNLNDDFLNASYNDHMIVAGRVSLLSNTQKSQRQRKYHFNKITLELAGNGLHGLSSLLGGARNENGAYTVFGIQYAQYVKVEEDFRLYRRIDESNSVAFRVHPGIGLSYGNLRVLPFEKSFFAGGANGIRAWQARTLGPGSFRDEAALETFNNIGDIRLEGSVEYRFKLTSMFEAALFVDAGNVWLLRPDDLRPGADFQFNRFVDEIAVGAGLGARLDFDYFLVRFDFGLQLKDPRKIGGERWLWQPKEEFLDYLEVVTGVAEPKIGVPLQFNLGIGYPF